MRIDDRKVNGRVLLDALDPVDSFNILVESTGATWQWRGSPLDPEVAAIRLDAMLEDTVPLGVRFCITAAEGQIYTVLSLPVYTVNKTAFDPVQFTIMLLGTSGNVKVLPMPAYTFDPGVTKLSIDIGELIAGVILDIVLPSGTITVKESK